MLKHLFFFFATNIKKRQEKRKKNWLCYFFYLWKYCVLKKLHIKWEGGLKLETWAPLHLLQCISGGLIQLKKMMSKSLKLVGGRPPACSSHVHCGLEVAFFGWNGSFCFLLFIFLLVILYLLWCWIFSLLFFLPFVPPNSAAI